MNIELTTKQIDTIKNSLRGSIARAVDKRIAIPATGLLGEESAVAFYVNLERECFSALECILKATDPEYGDGKDTCQECGEDHGFCQCEEEDDQ